MSDEMEELLFSAIKRKNRQLEKVGEVIIALYDMRLDAVNRGNSEESRTLRKIDDMLREAMGDGEEWMTE